MDALSERRRLTGNPSVVLCKADDDAAFDLVFLVPTVPALGYVTYFLEPSTEAPGVNGTSVVPTLRTGTLWFAHMDTSGRQTLMLMRVASGGAP